MRLFVAVELDETARGHLVKVQGRLDAFKRDVHGIRWIARENLHVTVKFLGEVGEPEMLRVLEQFNAVSFGGASLMADRLMCLPPRGPLSIVAAGLGGETGALERLHLELEDACSALGIRREGRPYLPHVTLGRRKWGGGRAMSRRDYEGQREGWLGWPGPSFRVESFVLMQSELRPKGSVYTPVARFPHGT